jgi:hypothetical protein
MRSIVLARSDALGITPDQARADLKGIFRSDE